VDLDDRRLVDAKHLAGVEIALLDPAISYLQTPELFAWIVI
jgi:hypothetical protein